MRTPEELATISADDWTPEERQRGLELAETKAEDALIDVFQTLGAPLEAAGDAARKMVSADDALRELHQARATISPPSRGATVDRDNTLGAALALAAAPAISAVSTDPNDKVQPPPDLGVTAVVKPPAPDVVGSIAPAKRYAVTLITSGGPVHVPGVAAVDGLARLLTGAALTLAEGVRAAAALVWSEPAVNMADNIVGAAVLTEAGWIVRVVE